MSSLAAVQADGFYKPPEAYDAGLSYNKHAKSHPLGVRAKKIDQGIIVIRFEMMYKAQCLGCDRYIGKGTRFNAEKKKCGMYFTTPLWEFKMKCASCSQRFIIQNDPQKRDYAFISGLRQKEERFDPKEAGTLVEHDTDTDKKARLVDPLLALEHAEEDKRKGNATITRTQRLMFIKEQLYSDDYHSNKVARATLRKKRKQVTKAKADGKAIGLNLSLLPATKEDSMMAKNVNFKGENRFKIGRKKKRLRIYHNSIFDGALSTDDHEFKLNAIAKGIELGIDSSKLVVKSSIDSTGSSITSYSNNQSDRCCSKSYSNRSGIYRSTSTSSTSSSSSSSSSSSVVHISKKLSKKKDKNPLLDMVGGYNSDSSHTSP